MTEPKILKFPRPVRSEVNVRRSASDHARTSEMASDDGPVLFSIEECRCRAGELRKTATQWEAVVLLHGLFADRHSMGLAQRRLTDAGYFVLNFGYPTWFGRIEQHVESLLPLLRQLETNEQVLSINFVTHSFGGILVRYALSHHKIQKTKRAVMLAPPNAGTHLAKYSLGAFDRLFPIVRQLSDSPDSIPNRLGCPEDLDVAVIAAKSDFVVRQENTRLKSQKAHCVVPTTHFRLPDCDEAIEKCLCFLKHGSFEQPVIDIGNATSKQEAIHRKAG